MLSDLFLEMFGLSLTAPQSSDDKLRACADDQHSQSGKEAQTNLVDMQNGEIENLDAGKNGFIRRGEVNLRLMEHIKNAVRGGEIVYFGIGFGDQLDQIGQVFTQKTTDAQLMDGFKGGADHGGCPLFVALPGSAFQCLLYAGDDLCFPFGGDGQKELFLAVVELIER